MVPFFGAPRYRTWQLVGGLVTAWKYSEAREIGACIIYWVIRHTWQWISSNICQALGRYWFHKRCMAVWLSWCGKKNDFHEVKSIGRPVRMNRKGYPWGDWR